MLEMWTYPFSDFLHHKPTTQIITLGGPRTKICSINNNIQTWMVNGMVKNFAAIFKSQRTFRKQTSVFDQIRNNDKFSKCQMNARSVNWKNSINEWWKPVPVKGWLHVLKKGNNIRFSRFSPLITKFILSYHSSVLKVHFRIRDVSLRKSKG